MSKPVVAIVGRPNVGNTTLFNVIAGDTISIVKDTPGVTRDRIYADCNWLDMNFTLTTTGEEGIQLLKQVKVFQPDVPVILMTAWGSISLAVQGMQAGAFDFVTKPWNNLVLLKSIRTAIELSEQKKEQKMPLNRLDADNKFHFDKIIGQSAPLMDVLGTVSRIAPTNASV